MIHEKVEYSHLRIYADGCSYENKDDYLCIMSVHHLGDDVKFISGLKGIMTRKIYKQIKDYFLKQGVQCINFERSNSVGKIVQCKITRG